ncbi:MAG: class 1 fructose-bisphosphatase [Candidatus Latescibacteria bacterium]|nr:class 1 fructose-bisphosphatase [Candidatus Latescibacterota bacterium]
MPNKNLLNVESHILDMQRLHPSASGDFTSLLGDIAFAAKVIAREVTRAGLVDILGSTGASNIQGETVQKLDDYANAIMLKFVGRRGQVCLMASEELPDPVRIDFREGSGKYVVVFDPLDGSSNIDANVSIGTIFSIYRRRSRIAAICNDDLLQPGRELAAAGYVVYGSSTMFVHTTGHGVHGYTLDPGIGEFLLSHENIKIPFAAGIYSVNEGHEPLWSPAVREVVRRLKYGRQESGGMSARYIGSLVADFHRNLLYGGVFLYPPTTKAPLGKLRLLYEAAPLAMIAENAGGYASDGAGPILDLVPQGVHQRTPLYLGSRETVLWIEKMLADPEFGSGSNGGGSGRAV